jgi:hypothetical protein
LCYIEKKKEKKDKKEKKRMLNRERKARICSEIFTENGQGKMIQLAVFKLNF